MAEPITMPTSAFRPSAFVNEADIRSTDKPVTVVAKLDRTFKATLTEMGASMTNGLFDYQRLWYLAGVRQSQPAAPDGLEDQINQLEGKLAARTPAAPGIDLPGWAFERPSGTDVIVVSAPNGKTWIAEPDDRLHMLAAAVIDHSTKGGSDAQDAARYRWLRDMRNRERVAELARYKMNLDAAIDAAMQATSAEVQP